eukprot:763380-Hanusia_phi.AAC.1
MTLARKAGDLQLDEGSSHLLHRAPAKAKGAVEQVSDGIDDREDSQCGDLLTSETLLRATSLTTKAGGAVNEEARAGEEEGPGAFHCGQALKPLAFGSEDRVQARKERKCASIGPHVRCISNAKGMTVSVSKDCSMVRGGGGKAMEALSRGNSSMPLYSCQCHRRSRKVRDRKARRGLTASSRPLH